MSTYPNDFFKSATISCHLIKRLNTWSEMSTLWLLLQPASGQLFVASGWTFFEIFALVLIVSRERWATIHVIIDDALCHNLLCACTFLPTRHRFDMGCLIMNNGSLIIQMLLQTWFWLATWVLQLMLRCNRPRFCWFTSCHMLLHPCSFIRDFNDKLLVQSKKCRGWSFRGFQVIFYFHIAK